MFCLCLSYYSGLCFHPHRGENRLRQVHVLATAPRSGGKEHTLVSPPHKNKKTCLTPAQQCLRCLAHYTSHENCDPCLTHLRQGWQCLAPVLTKETPAIAATKRIGTKWQQANNDDGGTYTTPNKDNYSHWWSRVEQQCWPTIVDLKLFSRITFGRQL